MSDETTSLIERNKVFELIEVKAKSYDSKNPGIEGSKGQILSEFLPYIQDVAFQKYVLTQAFPSYTVTSYLMMPDKGPIP